MDPPEEQVKEEIPEPKARMDSDSEMPQDAPPPVPPVADAPVPASAATGSVTAADTTSAAPPTLTEETPEQNDEKKDEPQAKATPTPTDQPVTASSETPLRTPTSNTATTKTSEEKDTPMKIEMPLSPTQRTDSFSDLRSYEAKRRSIYLKKLKSSSLYWKAFRDTLSKAYEETERAEILVQGSVIANKQYADYLTAAADDRLDYSGKPMEENKAIKYRGDKVKKYLSLGAGSLLWNAAHIKDSGKNQLNEDEKSRKEKLNASRNSLMKDGNVEGLPADSMLTSFIHCHKQLGEKFLENYTFVKEIALVKIKSLRQELEQEVHIMSQLGDVTIFELEKAEDDVQRNWAAYYEQASVKVGPITSSRNVCQNSVHDVWLVEMNYRMSVAYLTTIWEKCSAELSELFANMKELECNRRFRLSELLILYMQRSERLWLSVPSMITNVTKDLVSTPLDTDSIEKEVQQTIKDKAQAFQKNEVAEMVKDPIKNAPGLADAPNLKKGYELQSPLLSELLGKKDVIWRKNEKIMSVWKPTLAVATSDCYLHLFNIPHYSSVTAGSNPEKAFQELVPSVKVPTEESLKNGQYPHGSNWYDHLVPTDSIDLRCSKITFSESKGNSSFELTETLPPNKLSAATKFVRTKKLALRLYSSQHMVEWLLTLKNYGAE